MTTSTTTGLRMPKEDGRWWRFAVVLVITALTLVPLGGTLSSALGLKNMQMLGVGQSWGSSIVQSFQAALQLPSLYWLENSLMLAFSAVIVCVLIGAPAGYVLARGRGRLVSGYALVVFLMQSFPPIMLFVPLFLLFVPFHLVDNLFGLGLVYVGITLPLTVWMFAAYVDTIPIELEEAAWLDGCSVYGAFFRVVLRNSLPAVLTVAIFAFISVWNEYMAAFIFLRSPENFTLGVGLQASFHSPVLAVITALPPVIVFVALNRFFSIGGIAGSLGGR